MSRTSALAVLLAASSAQAQDTQAKVGLADYTLGMTLDEARAVKVSSLDEETLDLRCAGEKRASDALDLNGELRRSGVLMCSPHGSSVRNLYIPKRAKLGTASSLVFLYFKDGRLFRIGATFDLDDLSYIVGALKHRFGSDAVETTATARNRIGNEIPQSVITWTFGDQEVVLKAPSGNVNQMAVDYRIVSIDTEANKAMQADRAKASGI